MNLRTFHIVLSCLLLAAGVFAGNGNSYRFKTFSPKGGFYYDGVQSIVQDGDGFVWILLENDLQRFDGYEYKRYSQQFYDYEALNFWHLVTDSAGGLYVSTSQGLFRYEKQTDSFKKMLDRPAFALTIDSENILWCTLNSELYQMAPGDTLKKCLYQGKPVRDVKFFSNNKVSMYAASYVNRIYYASLQTPGNIQLFYQLPAGNYIAGICLSGEYLWTLTQKHDLLKINIHTRSIEEQWHIGDENVPLNDLYVDKNSNVWVGTQQGLYVLNSKTGNIQLCRHSDFDAFSLPNNSVWTIAGDSRQNVWIGTFAGGLCYVNLDEKLSLKTFTPYESDLSHNLVSSFAEDGKLLWLGTAGGGLNCLDRTTNTFTTYKSGGNNSLSYNSINSLALDAQRRLWIAMYRGGLDCFNTRTKQFRHFHHKSGYKQSLYDDNLRKVVLAGDSGLWITYQINKTVISFLSFDTETFKHYDFGNNSYIFDMLKDGVGNLWLLTDKHLYRMNGKTNKAENMSSGKIDNLNARSFGVDGEGNIWIGTIGRGLVCYNISTDKFTTYNNILRFNAYIINSICTDPYNYLWLGTNNGLFRYSIKEYSFRRFDESDGMQGNVYYYLASMRGSAGELYFGGTNGFSILDAASATFINKVKPRTLISNFYINNNAVPAPNREGNTFGNEIILNHRQDNFGFRFSSDNYLQPGKNRFKYRLRGYDDQWFITDAQNRTAMYSKIPAGTYYFEAQTANNDGVWGEPTVLKIRLTPAPWASWWAYTLYILIAISITGLILYYYYRQRKLKMQMYIDSLDQQKNEELHQSQLSFFTNISHDFRTPLSLILGALDNLKQEGLKEYYYNILHNNAKRLLNLVNELMDFRTLENGKMRLQVQPTNVNKLIEQFSSDFKDFAHRRHIQFTVSCDPKLDDMLYMDKHVLEKVVMNLLNNSFKYTKDGGSITISTCADNSKFHSEYQYSSSIPEAETPANGFLLVISDTGVGISQNSIHTVFNRYYKVNTTTLNQHLGTGIGLALVKSLVLLHRGAISVFSERDKGTDIAVCFPADASIYNESEFAEVEDTAELPVPNNSLKTISPAGGKKRILLAEDNGDLRTLIANFLAPHYEILEVENGVEASQILEQTDVDLILSDIMMPMKDGITLCREIKADLNTSHIPFVMLTAKTGVKAQIEGAGSGADLYFEKPMDFNLLLLSLKNIFNRQENLREHYARNYYANSTELSANEQDNAFLKKVIEVIEVNLSRTDIDISHIASELSMTQRKFYSKLKALTGKSAVQFILNYKLRRATRIMIEQDLSISQVMEQIGIKSLSYFTTTFHKEFGESPSAFAARHRKNEN